MLRAREVNHDFVSIGACNSASVVQHSYHFTRRIVAKDKSEGLFISVHNLPVRADSHVSARLTGDRVERCAVRLNVGDVVNQILLFAEASGQDFVLGEHRASFQKETPGDADAISGGFPPSHHLNKGNKHENTAGRSLLRLGDIWATWKAFMRAASHGRSPHRSGRLGRYPNVAVPGACQLRVYFPRRRSAKILSQNWPKCNMREVSATVPTCPK